MPGGLGLFKKSLIAYSGSGTNPQKKDCIRSVRKHYTKLFGQFLSGCLVFICPIIKEKWYCCISIFMPHIDIRLVL